MALGSEDKALLITFSGAGILALVFLLVTIKPFENKIPEEFYEIPIVTAEVPAKPPEEEAISPQEKQQISHKAYNSTDLQREARAYFKAKEAEKNAAEESVEKSEDITEEDTDDNALDYKKQLAELRNRKAALPTPENTEALENLPKKPSTGMRNSTVSYSLEDRIALKIPNPVYTCDALGKVVINIEVSNNGTILKTTYNKGASTTTNGCLVDQALEYAESARFNSATKEKQLGTITFHFQG